MAKDKTAFFCRECGAKSAVWIGRCPQCGAWNSYEQEVIHRSGSGQLKNLSTPKAVTMLMSNIECSNEQRIDLKDDELNRVLGGGSPCSRSTFLCFRTGCLPSTRNRA